MQIGPFGVSVANTKDSRLAEQIGGSGAIGWSAHRWSPGWARAGYSVGA